MDPDGFPAEVARAQHTATLMPTGLVAVVGGEHGPTPTTELYDSSNATWTLSGNLVQARTAHRTVLLPNGNILAVAGQGNPTFQAPLAPAFDNQALKSAEIGIFVGDPTPTPTATPTPTEDSDSNANRNSNTDRDSDSNANRDSNTD